MDPFDFLLSLEVLGMKFGLENMTALCAALGHPEASFRSVIVAGTNGKGSVTAMASAALHAAGHRVARYTSPHLERLEERFVIGEQEVPTALLGSAVGAVQTAVDQLLQTGALASPPTFFECTTAAAFELFKRAGVEIAVLEVGLGGRLDATNVVSPLVAAITSIDLDHQAQLGTTLTAVAREKAGVIKPGIPVVCGPVPPAAREVIAGVCLERGARLIEVGVDVRLSSSTGPGGRTIATIATPRRRLENVTLALAGRHQAMNAATALAILDELGPHGCVVSDEAAAAGLSRARWPGRLERLASKGCEILLDAAHNPAGARALAAYLRDAGWNDVTLLVGVMRDKDVRGILEALLPGCTRLVCTAPRSPRALPAAELAAIAASLPASPAVIEAFDDPGVALERACRSGGRVAAAGSIFLIGPLRGILR